ncbi:MAG: hypothetical protein EHM47_07585 [Ignavibacteriales bacterium]|nr:MAG: hypothetical protein EHM47_07585 [Ignavibacteriales bacterium]
MDCIWMASGLVKYKLCDKDFDCENCEFDKVMMNFSAKLSDNQPQKSTVEMNDEDILEKLVKRIEAETFDEKIIYLKNQLILKNLFGNAYYLGVNPIVLYLLDDFSTLNDFNNNEIKRNQIIFTLEGSWGLKKFISPIDFMVIEKINFSQFKLNKWYAIILFNGIDREDYFLSLEEWTQKKYEALSYLKKNLNKNPDIGQSMMDGGKRIKFLHQFIGRNNYLNLLNKVYA